MSKKPLKRASRDSAPNAIYNFLWKSDARRKAAESLHCVSAGDGGAAALRVNPRGNLT